MLSQESQLVIHAVSFAAEGLQIFNLVTQPGSEFNPYDTSTWGIFGKQQDILSEFLGVCAQRGLLPESRNFPSALRTFTLGTAPIRALYKTDPQGALIHKGQMYHIWLQSFERALDMVLNPVP